jgi:predicted DNA-binding WGR domain protein
MQLIEHEDSWFLFTKWGRIGGNGSNKLSSPISDKARAVDRFVEKLEELLSLNL